MLWNRLFWAFFALTESALIAILTLDFSYLHVAGAFLVLLMGSWKLMEDARCAKKGGRGNHRVRRDILNKLKN